MSDLTHEFQVAMTCEGCSGAINRILDRNKDKGISNVDIDLPGQRVYVKSSLKPEELLELIKKAGKETSYIGTK